MHRLLHSPLVGPELLIVLGLAWILVRALRRSRAVPTGSWVHVELTGAIHDLPPALRPWQQWIARRRLPISVLGLERVADRIIADHRVAGVLFEIRSLAVGWATAESLHALIARIRKAGKRTVVYLPWGASTRQIMVASAAETIVASPQATLSPLGAATEQTFYKQLLGRAGIEAESLSRREFKSAAESFTRDGISDANRMQIGELLDALHEGLVRMLVDNRGLDREAAQAIVDTGMLSAREAQERKLIDEVLYEDQMYEKLGIRPGQLVSLLRYRWARISPSWGSRRAKRVGIVEVRGPIVLGNGGSMLSRAADARSVVAALRVARKNPHIGAVVLAVDSPGGSSLASDLIAREVERLRDKKPVVAYFGDVAASGGYYISAMAHEIVAQPTTITGSIGVVALRFVFQRTLEKLGLTHEVIRRGERADVMSPYRKWTDTERELFDHEIDRVYQDFVGIVARGRGKAPEEIEPLARGRVYAGRDALAKGLVDRLGGLHDAVERAAQRGGVRVDVDPIRVVAPAVYPEAVDAVGREVAMLLGRLGLDLQLLTLAARNGHEHIFAFDDRLTGFSNSE